MAKRYVKLLAVVAFAGGCELADKPTTPAAKSSGAVPDAGVTVSAPRMATPMRPRTLRNGEPAPGNVATRAPRERR